MNNKGLIITLIVILSIIAITLIGGFIFLLYNVHGFNFTFDFNGGEMTLVESKEIQEDIINNIEVTLKSADLEIKQSENKILKVELYSINDEKPTIKVEDNCLKIDEQRKNEVNVIFANNRKKVVLYVPTEYIGEFNITATSGDILSSVDMINNKINVVTTSGDIVLNQVGTSNIIATSGDVVIDRASKNINIKTTSGSISINELSIEENSNIEATSGDVKIYNNISNCYVDAKTSSGDARINKSDRKSEVELKIKTTSGDINVK